MDTSVNNEVYKRIARDIEEQAVAQVGGFKPNPNRPEVESQDTLFQKYQLPEYLKGKIAIEQDDTQNQKLVSRLIVRNDESVANIEKRILKNQEEKRNYWDEMGKEEMMKMVTWGNSLSEEELKLAQNITWDYRDCFGNGLSHISAGCRYFAIKIEPTIEQKPQACLRRASSAFAKALWEKYLDSYVKAGLAIQSTCSAISNAFLLRKPKTPAGIPKVETVADLQRPEVTPEVLNKHFRLVIDLSQQNKFCAPFSAPSPSAREILRWFAQLMFILSLDALAYFSQIKLDPVTRQTQFTFQGCTNTNYESTGAVMGHCSSMQLGNILMQLMFCDILTDHTRLSYADNMNVKSPSIGQLLSLYERILERSRLFNLTWKLSDTHIAMSTSRSDEEFECLGFTIGKNGIQIPKRRKDQYIDGIPRTRKEIVRLIGRVNFFSGFSMAFADILKDIRYELALMKARKFTMTPRLEAALKACIALYVNSPGVWFLSEEDYATKPFILFVDASQKSWGAVVLALVDGELLPLRATSKTFSKLVQNWCSNRKEAYAVHQALQDLTLLLQGRPFFILSDSAFTVDLFSRPIVELAPKLRGIALLARESFLFRIMHISGIDNHIADTLSRVSIMRRSDETKWSEEDFKWVKRHMRPMRVAEETALYLQKEHEDFQHRLSFNIQDKISDDIQQGLPTCYSINKEVQSEPICDDQSPCCNVITRTQMADQPDEPQNLTTIHRVDQKMKQSMAPMLSNEQRSRLNVAEFMVLTNNEDGTAIAESLFEVEDISENKRMGNKPSGSHHTEIDNRSKQDKDQMKDFSSDESEFMAIANKADAPTQEDGFSSNDSDFLAIGNQANKPTGQSEKFDSDDSDFQAMAEKVNTEEPIDVVFQATAEQLANVSLQSKLRENDAVRPKLKACLKSKVKSKGHDKNKISSRLKNRKISTENLASTSDQDAAKR